MENDQTNVLRGRSMPGVMFWEICEKTSSLAEAPEIVAGGWSLSPSATSKSRGGGEQMGGSGAAGPSTPRLERGGAEGLGERGAQVTDAEVRSRSSYAE